MQNQKSDHDLRYLLVRFSLVTLGSFIGSLLASFLIVFVFATDPSLASWLLTGIIPAADAGRVFVRRFGRRPDETETWLLATIFGVFQIILVFGATVWADMQGDQSLHEVIRIAGFFLVAAVLSVTTAIGVLVARASLDFGVKFERRQSS